MYEITIQLEVDITRSEVNKRYWNKCHYFIYIWNMNV